MKQSRQTWAAVLLNWQLNSLPLTSGQIQFDLNTSQGRLIANLIAILAEFERDLVCERVRSEIAAAKARGQKLGRQPGQRVKADRLTPKVLQMVEQGNSYRQIAGALHLSKTTVNEIVKRHRQLNQSSQIELKQPTMADQLQSTAESVYQLKITLKDFRPSIWRRVQVKSDITLGKLHKIIQASMGWTNSHLHGFSIGAVEYGQPLPQNSTIGAMPNRVRCRTNSAPENSPTSIASRTRLTTAPQTRPRSI